MTTIPISPTLTRVLDATRQAGLPVLLSGSHGIGKSEFLEGYAHARGLSPYVLDLSLLEATDLTGIPYIEDGRTRFAPPSTLPPRDAGPCLLVLEELNRCDRSVRQPCLQLLTTRRLNDYQLPPDCFLAACVNPEDSGYEVDALDPALASRFVTLTVVPDHAAWLEWARKNQLFPGIVRFVEKFAQAFDRAPPRTWTYAARLIESALSQGWSTAELELLLTPVLKPMTTRALLMDLPDTMPSIAPEALLARPEEYLGSFRVWKDKGRHDVMGVVLENLRQHLLAGRGAGPGVEIDKAGMSKVLDLCPADVALPVLELLEQR